MDDRTLLELAAKAAGIEISEWVESAGYFFGRMRIPADPSRNAGPRSDIWNPLTDDGDALRLAVKLEICITYSVNDIKATFAKKWKRGEPEEEAEATERHRDDAMSATRRAIVRAAAEIGKSI